ncbi:hypothetical protein FCH28_12855 [Streptomyces piniterrae]|uniref:Uncharacterized protein n=1 Tax=Streptomyces piniterrae TaxID=2571125 RepID=A0A4U0NII6_9ACTN|nr:hypothetical protein FCH28_12855 [Streptomyces piniterrae]
MVRCWGAVAVAVAVVVAAVAVAVAVAVARRTAPGASRAPIQGRSVRVRPKVRACRPSWEPPATPRLNAEALIAVTRVGAAGAAARARPTGCGRPGGRRGCCPRPRRARPRSRCAAWTAGRTRPRPRRTG